MPGRFAREPGPTMRCTDVIDPPAPSWSAGAAAASWGGTGTTPSTVVPRPGSEVRLSHPPTSVIRRRTLRSPRPDDRSAPAGGTNPGPLSLMVKRSVPPASAIRTVTGAPAACLTALLTDSRQQRNTADSTSGGYRLPGAMSAVIATGLAAPASSRSSATASPWSVSSIERTPPTVSVSTRSAASSWPASMSRRWTADSVRPLFASNSTSPSASRPDTR